MSTVRNPFGLLSGFVSGVGAGAGFTAARAGLKAAGLAANPRRNPAVGDLVRLPPDLASQFGSLSARVLAVKGGGLFGGSARATIIAPTGVQGTVDANKLRLLNPSLRETQDILGHGPVEARPERRRRPRLAFSPAALGTVLREEYGAFPSFGPSGVRFVTPEGHILGEGRTIMAAAQAAAERIGLLQSNPFLASMASRPYANPIVPGEERVLYLPQDAFHGNLLQVRPTGRFRVPEHVLPKDAGRAREYEVIVQTGDAKGKHLWVKSFHLLRPERLRHRPLDQIIVRTPTTRVLPGQMGTVARTNKESGTNPRVETVVIAGQKARIIKDGPAWYVLTSAGDILGTGPTKQKAYYNALDVHARLVPQGQMGTVAGAERGDRAMNPRRFAMTFAFRRLESARVAARELARFVGPEHVSEPIPTGETDPTRPRYLIGTTVTPPAEATRVIQARLNPSHHRRSNPMNAQLARARAIYDGFVREEMSRLTALPGASRAKFRLAALRARARYRQVTGRVATAGSTDGTAAV